MSSYQGSIKDTSETKAISYSDCQSKSVRGNGRLKGVQRYVCKNCGKNFSQTTGKFWFELKKKDKIQKYLYCLLSGYSIRKSAKETGISIQTSFDWRHKLLTSFSVVSPEGFEGIVESDDLFFLHFEKGNKNLDRKPRQRGTKVGKAEVLCSDSHRGYSAFAKDIKVEHKNFNASKGQRKTEKIYHVQNVNNMDKRLSKTFL